MKFELSADIESIAKSAVLAGTYPSIDAFIEQAVREKAEEVASISVQAASTGLDEWTQKLYALRKKCGVNGYPADDSRRSMYPDRW